MECRNGKGAWINADNLYPQLVYELTDIRTSLVGALKASKQPLYLATKKDMHLEIIKKKASWSQLVDLSSSLVKEFSQNYNQQPDIPDVNLDGVYQVLQKLVLQNEQSQKEINSVTNMNNMLQAQQAQQQQMMMQHNQMFQQNQMQYHTMGNNTPNMNRQSVVQQQHHSEHSIPNMIRQSVAQVGNTPEILEGALDAMRKMSVAQSESISMSEAEDDHL